MRCRARELVWAAPVLQPLVNEWWKDRKGDRPPKRRWKTEGKIRECGPGGTKRTRELRVSETPTHPRLDQTAQG